MEPGKKQGNELPRKLGGDWEGWDGRIEENNGDLDKSPAYFLLFLIITTGIVMVGMGLLLFLIMPRMHQLHPMVAQMTAWVGGSILAALLLGVLAVILTVLTERPFAFFLKGKELANHPLALLSLKIGQELGFSKDRLRNSLLKIGNALTRSFYKSVKPEGLLIVAPRCLSMMIRKELEALTQKYGITFHTASGGNKARELLVTQQPKAIIGVACERDLFSGVQDVGGKIPVITIANKRPDGPCINTFINLEEMEEAIRFFLGLRVEAQTDARFRSM